MTWEEAVQIARALPAVELDAYHGYPALRVAGKFLVRLGDDGESLEFKALGFDEREMLIAAAPDVFFIPAAFKGRGVFARLASLDEASLRALLERRWRAIAPKELLKAGGPA